MTRVPITKWTLWAMDRSGSRTPADTGGFAGRALVVALLWSGAMVLLLASVLLDPYLYRVAHVGKESIEWHAWYQVFRMVGTLYFWIAAGLAVGLARPGAWRRRVRAALWVFGAAALAGLLAEVLKVAIGRERPILNDGSSVFRSISQVFLSTRDLSFPSSHAAVAFGGAWMVWRLRGTLKLGRWLGWAAPLTAGICGASRMLTGAHFFGDIVGAAIVGALAAMVVHRLIHPSVARRCPEVCLLRRHRPGRGRPAACTLRA